MNETCDCEDCVETPCEMDCDLDSLCKGCYDSLEDSCDIEFESKWQLGYR